MDIRMGILVLPSTLDRGFHVGEGKVWREGTSGERAPRPRWA